MTDDTKRADAHQALEDALAVYAGYCTDSDEIITDAVLLIAAQHIDEDGNRCGRVFIMPRHGYQPIYITKGLITDALDAIRLSQKGD